MTTPRPEQWRNGDHWAYTWPADLIRIELEQVRREGRSIAAVLYVRTGEVDRPDVWHDAFGPAEIDLHNAGQQERTARALAALRLGRYDWTTMLWQACKETSRLMREGKVTAPERRPLRELMRTPVPRQPEVIPGLLSEGVWVWGGKPKLARKSWTMLNLALAKATGGTVLGTRPAGERGGALYLALEDSDARLQDRTGKLIGPGGELPENVDVYTQWSRMDAGGYEELDAWLTENPTTRLVMIDTWGKFRPLPGRNTSRLYDEDYAPLAQLGELARRHHCCIICVHHLRKGRGVPDDPFEEFSGTTGFTGAVDGMVVLVRPNAHELEAQLHIQGRDLAEEQELGLTWDDTIMSWRITGTAEEARLSRQRRLIWDMLRDAGETQSPKDISEETKLDIGSVKTVLRRMVRDGQVTRVAYGKYAAGINPTAERLAAAARGNIPIVSVHSSETAEAAQIQDGKVVHSVTSESENREQSEQADDSRQASDSKSEQSEQLLHFDDDEPFPDDDPFVEPPQPGARAGPHCPSCGRTLPAGDGCWACDDRACEECGESTHKAIRRFCAPCGMRSG